MYRTEYKVKNLINPAELCDTKFLGRIGEKFDNVIRERLSGEYARKEVFGEAESAFDTQADDADEPFGIWQGEFWGKQMISACRAYRYNGDTELKSFIKESTYRIMSHQREDGYLGTYKAADRVFSIGTDVGRALKGWPCDWNWNIWCRKYTLWGMLEAYEILDDEKILEVCVKFTDQLIDMLKDMGARICETGVFYGQPSGSIMKPVLVLYRHTGNRKYLDFALEIAKEWEDEDTCCTKLITKALCKVPIADWSLEIKDIIPKSEYNPYGEECRPVYDVKNALQPEYAGKVYETLSCFDGLLELYRITGDEKYLTAAKNFFELMMKHEYNTLCSVGFNDKFVGAAYHQNSISELCDVIHFIRLATELHKLCGDARYIDIAELAFCNCFLAGVTRDGKWGARGVRAAEGHLYAYLQAEFTKNHCCVNNMPRGFANIAETIAMTDGKDIYVNFYTPAQAAVKLGGGEEVNVTVGDGYLQYQEVTLRICANTAQGRKLKLRIPAWSKYTTAEAYGKTYVINESGYFDLELKFGESEIKLSFDSTPRLVEGDYNLDFYTMTPYLKRRYFDKDGVNPETVISENKATLFVGPTLLCASRDLGSTKEEIFDRKTVVGGDYKVKLVPKTAEGFVCAFDAYFETSKEGCESFSIPMGDFASASDTAERLDYRYSVFI